MVPRTNRCCELLYKGSSWGAKLSLKRIRSKLSTSWAQLMEDSRVYTKRSMSYGSDQKLLREYGKANYAKKCSNISAAHFFVPATFGRGLGTRRCNMIATPASNTGARSDSRQSGRRRRTTSSGLRLSAGSS